MGLPKKGSRTIHVNGQKYRYTGVILPRDFHDPGHLIVELAENPGQRFRCGFSYKKLSAEYNRVGRGISREIERFPPFVVRQAILYAIENGWNPDESGPIIEFGLLDEKIDFSSLKVES